MNQTLTQQVSQPVVEYWTPIKAAPIKAKPLPGIVTIWTLTSEDVKFFMTPPKAPKKAPKKPTLNPYAQVFVPKFV